MSFDDHNPSDREHDATFKLIAKFFAAINQELREPTTEVCISRRGVLLDVRKDTNRSFLSTPWGNLTVTGNNFSAIQAAIGRFDLGLVEPKPCRYGTCYQISDHGRITPYEERIDGTLPNHPGAREDLLRRIAPARCRCVLM